MTSQRTKEHGQAHEAFAHQPPRPMRGGYSVIAASLSAAAEILERGAAAEGLLEDASRALTWDCLRQALLINGDARSLLMSMKANEAALYDDQVPRRLVHVLTNDIEAALWLLRQSWDDPGKPARLQPPFPDPSGARSILERSVRQYRRVRRGGGMI